MVFQHILLLTIIQGISSYYIYNADTNQVLRYPSLNNLPKGFKIIRAPKYLTRQKNKSNTQRLRCQEEQFICDEPYDKSSTYQFECEYDTQCPKNYLCCPQKCFRHKVCSRGASLLTSKRRRKPSWSPNLNSNTNSFDTKSRQCEKWPYPCPNPYPESFSYRFKCESDVQCPRDHLCCEQNCFRHKICSKNVAVNQYIEELRITEKPVVVTTTSVSNKNEEDDEELDKGSEVIEEVSTTTDETENEEDNKKLDEGNEVVEETSTTTDDGENEEDKKKFDEGTVVVEDASTTTNEPSTTNTITEVSISSDSTNTDELVISTMIPISTTLATETTTVNLEITSNSDGSTLDPNAIYPEFFYNKSEEEDYSEEK